MVTAYIAVGSNIKPDENILRALGILLKKIRVLKTSPFYRTQALGRPDQDDYLNGVWQIETEIDPLDLKYDVLRPIEARLGRVRSDDKYAARPIDLDLVLYGDRTIESDELTLPDPDIDKRDFIAIPLYQLNNTLVLPKSKKSLSVIVDSMDFDKMVQAVDLTRKMEAMINGNAGL